MKTTWRGVVAAVTGALTGVALVASPAGADPRPGPESPAAYTVPGVPRKLDPGLLRHAGTGGKVWAYVDGPDRAKVRAAVRRAGGTVSGERGSTVRAEISPKALVELAGSGAVTEVRQPDRAIPLAVTSEGVAASGAGNWIRDGKTGAGVKVGVIDVGFADLADAQDAGELPTGSALTLHGADCPGSGQSSHGTAVAETLHDVAPGAILHLACAPDSVTFAAAADRLRAQGVSIILSAVGFPATGRGDGTGATGTPADVVRAARLAGVLWVNAAGNAAQQHWSGTAADANANSYMEFSGTAETNGFSLPPGGSAQVFLRWDGWPTTRQDLNLIVMSRPQYPAGPTDPLIAGLSTRAQADSQTPLSPTETVTITNSTGAIQQYYIFVPARASYAGTRADLFVQGDADSIQFAVPGGSVLEPATSPYALATGATRPGSGRIQAYSSQGPTIDGRRKPDLTGFDATSTFTYGPAPAAAGTSFAAAHVAGTAALLKGANTALDAAVLQTILEDRADPSASDNVWGHGTLALGAPFVPQPVTGAGFRPAAVPARLLDSSTATGGHNRQFTDGEVFTLPVDGARSDTTAVAVTLTAWSDQRTTLALARDADGLADGAAVDLMPGEKRSITSVVTLGSDRAIRLRNTGGAAHASVDLLGQFDPAAAGLYTPADQPAAILDTTLTAGQVHALGVRGVGGVPAIATAVQLNVTAREGTEESSIAVYAQDRPAAYTTLESASYRVRNTVTVSAIGDDGAVRIRNDRGTVRVAVEVVGWYAAGDGSRYVALPRPARLLDTRTGTGAPQRPLGTSDTALVQVSDVAAIPRGATAAVVSLTGAGDGWTSLSAGPAESGWSGRSAVDGIAAGATQTGVTVARLGRTGRLRIRNDAGSAQVAATVAGYFTGGPELADDTGSCTLDAEAGFTPLHDGRSRSSRGWLTAGAGTATESGCELTPSGSPSVRWYAAEHLPSDYTLRLDFRTTAESADSGVYLGFPDPGTDPGGPGVRGVEAQIKHDGAGGTATGALTGVAGPATLAERPVGEWNAYEIQVAGKRVTVRLNDAVVNDQVVPEGRLVSSGHVGLQGGAVAFRNIRVRADRPAARAGALTGAGGRCLDVQFANPADGTKLTLFPCQAGKENQAVTLPGDGTIRVMGKCVDALGPINGHGVHDAHLWTCHGLAAQQWVAQPNGRLLNPSSGNCLDAQTDDTAMLHVYPCHDGANQKWTLPSAQAAWGPVTGIAGRCVDLDGYGRANGTAVQLWDCHNEWNQHVTVPGDGTLRVGGKCLDGNGPATGDPDDKRIKLWECNGLPFQQFLPRPDGSLYFPLTGRCVDAPASDNGAKLYLHACHGGANQRFALPVRAPAGVLRSDPAARLVAHLPMDETSGTTAADASGLGHRASLTGGAGWGPGQRGNALSLDGSNDAAATGTPVVQTTRSFSVAAWVRPSRAADTWFGVVAQDDAQHSGFAIETSPDQGRWEFIVWPNRATGEAKAIQSATRVTAGQWVHLVAVYDQAEERMRIYVNGQLEAETVGAPQLPQATGPTTVGRTMWNGGGANFFPGQIDDVRLYEGVLSAADIAELGRPAARRF
ncbi:ricin-type beta-trefoil lectin domain protein [Actinoplanes sp. NBRC 103695]|uniref:ricin-type beta-trefoil lectin domain protein n=1 Tax=Actinoplanes sp. NBRC 103695 TaxID=3032202 RepID=UPI0025567D80|nr:ricin-type beta-trefoil lectin domain protein [Actinoplanes sp. NBRC 103695]